MRGNFWLREQERLAPGFLRRAYASRPFTDASDAEVADLLSPMAELHGATVTADVIGKERLRLGMRRCKSERKAKAAPLAVEHLPATLPEVLAPAAPEQPPLPGVELEGRGVWALYREMRELKAAILALTKALNRERAA